MPKKRLTEHQLKTFERVQELNGAWFMPYKLPATLRRPEFTCEILEEKGWLESRVRVGALREYREVVDDT